MTQLDIKIEPEHQEIAARLGLALLDSDPARVDAALSETAARGLDGVLAVLAVQSWNLAAMMAALQGLDDARAVLQRTILDAKLARDE